MAVKQQPICQTTFKLNNGSSIPAVGLGTWQGRYGTDDADKLRESIVHALRTGYRLIDTASLYGVERIVGEAIRASGVPREEITVVTKVWCDMHHDPGTSLERSLSELQLDYVDILLMHWPCALTPDGKKPLMLDESPTYVETWKMMEKLVEGEGKKKCRSIGVSNFTQKLLEVLLREATVVPVVNQVELHALNPNLNLVPYCQSRGIQVMSWSTLGSHKANEILTHPLFVDIAKNHNCSTAVVSLSWCVQRGIIVIPRSGSLARIEENIRLVKLTPEEMDTMNQAHRTIRQFRISDHILQYDVPGKGTTLLGWTNQEFGFEDEKGNWLV
ncbi:hypothetical protein VTN77DRAFT_3732 [Rasamsonia byssochlamydoides]|uniref:uncharacterized protein n=1 Tax=Rasamsonia byssochlamydoides TaxID=89139 RepID=UPI0037423B03